MFLIVLVSVTLDVRTEKSTWRLLRECLLSLRGVELDFSEILLAWAYPNLSTYVLSASEEEKGMHKTLSKRDFNSFFIGILRKTLAQNNSGGDLLFLQ